MRPFHTLLWACLQQPLSLLRHHLLLHQVSPWKTIKLKFRLTNITLRSCESAKPSINWLARSMSDQTLYCEAGAFCECNQDRLEASKARRTDLSLACSLTQPTVMPTMRSHYHIEH